MAVPHEPLPAPPDTTHPPRRGIVARLAGRRWPYLLLVLVVLGYGYLASPGPDGRHTFSQSPFEAGDLGFELERPTYLGWLWARDPGYVSVAEFSPDGRELFVLYAHGDCDQLGLATVARAPDGLVIDTRVVPDQPLPMACGASTSISATRIRVEPPVDTAHAPAIFAMPRREPVAVVRPSGPPVP